MKKIISILSLFSLVFLCACSTRKELSRDLLDYDFKPAHDETIVECQTIISGDNVIIVPITTVHHFDDEYKLKFHITYDDNTYSEKWERVTEHEYDNALKELNREEE